MSRQGYMGDVRQNRERIWGLQLQPPHLNPFLLKDSLKILKISLCPKLLGEGQVLPKAAMGAGVSPQFHLLPASPLMSPLRSWGHPHRPTSLPRRPLQGIMHLMDVACLHESSASRSQITQMYLLSQIIL